MPSLSNRLTLLGCRGVQPERESILLQEADLRQRVTRQPTHTFNDRKEDYSRLIRLGNLDELVLGVGPSVVLVELDLVRVAGGNE